MSPSPSLRELVDRCAPLWAAEAEIIRTYLDDETRTPERDRRWIIHQAYKEYWDGYATVLSRLQPGDEDIERTQHLIEVMQEELAHYVAFAALHALAGTDPRGPLTPTRAKEEGPWPENDALRDVRARHRREDPTLGRRAQWLSEGGYAALYREGAAIRGRGGFDDAIAAVCQSVYDDEIDHMLEGLRGLDESSLSPTDWQRLIAMVCEQLVHRLHMRQAQFGHPVDPTRMEELCRGLASPQPFAWDRVSDT